MTNKQTIMVLNGPNLNLLGQREPEIYGRESLDDIKALCKARAEKDGLAVAFCQSNHEGVLIDYIHEAIEKYEGLVLNPGAFTHSSLALYDALLCCSFPVIEVHLSNIHAREDFRQKSLTARAARAVICGMGSQGYVLALRHMAELLEKK